MVSRLQSCTHVGWISLPILLLCSSYLYLLHSSIPPFRGGKIFPFKEKLWRESLSLQGGNFLCVCGHFTQHMGSQFADQGSNWCLLHQKIDLLENNLRNVCIFDWVFLAVAVFLYFQEPGLPFLVVHGLLIAAVSLVAECRLHQSQCVGAVVEAPGLVAQGDMQFPWDQGLILRPLLWEVDTYPLHHRESARGLLLCFKVHCTR